MAKPKVVVGEDEDEGKSEGLEITSIGYLYKGPWEKKYWSSSRGKDRYPFPVGYHAVRAHNGSTCKMEIHEGPKGPLFLITYADGHSYSGQTPDIAWEKFQKKHCSRMKTWHGKRLSCKIDGVEFFGFKNSFVQRLLRELVADINGTAERSFLSSRFCNEASNTMHDNQNPDACTVSQPHFQKTPVTKKRSRKNEVTNMEPVGSDGFKKPRSANEMNYKHGRSVSPSSSKGRNFLRKIQGLLQPSVHLSSKTIDEKNGNFSSQEGLLSGSIGFSGLLSEGSIVAPEVANNLIEDEKPLDRSKKLSFLDVTEDEARDAQVLKDSQCAENVNLFAPDTLDFSQDNIMPSSSTTHKSNYSLKGDFTTANNVISKGVVADTHTEEDFDSVGQEIKEAMMTVLLPQAIPLLNKVSRKNRLSIGASETSPFRANIQEGKNETSHLMDAASPAAIEKTISERESKLQTQDVDLGFGVPIENSKSVPDSFEDDQHQDNQVIFSSNAVEGNEHSIDKDINIANTQNEHVVEDAKNESLICHVETRNNKNGMCHEVNTSLNKKILIRDASMSESVLECRSSSKEVLSENKRDVFANLDKNSACIEIHPVEKELKIEPECTGGANDGDKNGMTSTIQPSRTDIPIKVATSNAESLVQVPSKVYFRKKVTKSPPLTKEFFGPLSESIIFRNLVVDDQVPEQNHVASEFSQMRSSDDKPHGEKFVCAKDMLEGQSHGLPVLSQNSTVFSNSKDKDFFNSIGPSTLSMKSEANSCKVPGEQVNLVELNSYMASQKQEISCCGYASFNTEEAKVISDSKLQKNVESNNELAGIFDIVGCYFHPMPILSVLLRTIGNEIYVCVSCGFVVDRKRTLFIYKVGIQEPRIGNPSFVGYTSVMLPFLKDNFGREIAMERSCALCAPDGQYLVLLDSVKTPYCREGRIDCLCSTCKSHCFEENAVKIVEVKAGYVSIVAKLKIDDSVQCILVCEPNHLIAVGESGRLHLWKMNSTWSAQIEECAIPINDHIYPCIVELKRIPKSESLVLGYNGFGEFGIWDISKRAFVSRFSSPSTSICQIFPISWQRNGMVFMDTNLDLSNVIGAATKSWSSKHSENSSPLPSEGEDIAIWLLVSTLSDSDAQHNCTSSDVQITPTRFWRIALLVKNMVIMGSPLDPRAAAIGALSNHGIIGINDGLVYVWELSSGNKLGTLHHFKGGTVSCVATDDSVSQVLAVAGEGPDGGQLLVYLHSQESVANR